MSWWCSTPSIMAYPPARLKRVEGDAVPRFMGAKKMSLHQTGFQEVLAMAELLGDYPEHLLLIGVQPVALEDFGGSLRPEVKARIAPAIDLALEYLAEFGVVPLPERAPSRRTTICHRRAPSGTGPGCLRGRPTAAGAGLPHRRCPPGVARCAGVAALMCIAVPMQVVASSPGWALCSDGGDAAAAAGRPAPGR